MQKKSLFKVNENSYVHEKKANATTSAVTGGVETKSFLAPLRYLLICILKLNHCMISNIIKSIKFNQSNIFAMSETIWNMNVLVNLYLVFVLVFRICSK